MKRIYSIIAVMMMAMAAVTLAGCDDDNDIAYTLDGVWEGYMYKQSIYNGRYYTSNGTTLQFDQDPYRYARGTGRWIDYYSDAPWDYFASYIQWKVSNGTIIIYSEKEDQYYYISDYRLYDNYFEGYISDEGGNEKHFRLTKTASRNWSDYNWNGYDWDDYYYAPAQKSVTGNKEMPKTSIMGNDK